MNSRLNIYCWSTTAICDVVLSWDAGLKPEDMLRQLAKKNVDYHFLEVNSSYTTKMTNIFKACYPQDGNASCSFNVLPLGTNPAKFMPTVLRSITMSASKVDSYFSKSSSRRPGFTGHEYDEDNAADLDY